MADITLEQVEKLRARCDLGYEEARNLLEKCGGSVLDALIELERQGRAAPPGGNGQAGKAYTPEPSPEAPPSRPPVPVVTGSAWENFWKDAKGLLGKLWGILREWNRYQLQVQKKGRAVTAIPLWVTLILIVCVPWITVPMLIAGLFMHCRYELVKEE